MRDFASDRSVRMDEWEQIIPYHKALKRQVSSRSFSNWQVILSRANETRRVFV